MTKSYKNLQSQSYDPENADFTSETLGIIIEQKVELAVDKEVFLTFYCSPLDLEALAVGFLWNEGIISDLNEIKNLSVNTKNSRIDVSLLNTIKNKKTLLRSSSGVSVEDQTEKEQLCDQRAVDRQIPASGRVQLPGADIAGGGHGRGKQYGVQVRHSGQRVRAG